MKKEKRHYCRIDPVSGKVLAVTSVPEIVIEIPEERIDEILSGEFYHVDGAILPKPRAVLTAPEACVVGQFFEVIVAPPEGWKLPDVMRFSIARDVMQIIASGDGVPDDVDPDDLPEPQPQLVRQECKNCKPKEGLNIDEQGRAHLAVVPTAPGTWRVQVCYPHPWHSNMVSVEVAEAPKKTDPALAEARQCDTNGKLPEEYFGGQLA